MQGFLNRGALKGLEDYIIPLTGQKLGEQNFDYTIDTSFIKAYQDSEITNCDIKAEVSLIRNNQTFQFNIKLKGKISVPCDRCLEPVKLKVKHKAKLVIKIADKYEEINDELISIPEEDSDFDLSVVFYQYIKLSTPLRKVHNEGDCDPNMINILDQLAPEENKTDSRWDDLKKLLNNN